MTKHNAEMENSREQSRVCARLPLNLQLFAEDTGENGADTNAEGAAGDTDANSDGGNTTPTFDELLKDKKFQSEFDSRVSKALATARAKWEESAKEQADEAKKLSSMNKEERGGITWPRIARHLNRKRQPLPRSSWKRLLRLSCSSVSCLCSLPQS